MTRSGFEGRARVVSGSEPSPTAVWQRVTVADGRLRVAVEGSTGAVLDLPLDRVSLEPLGRAGASVVLVDGSPILVDFTRRAHDASPGPGSAVGRVVHGLSGRWTRSRFAAAVRRGRR